MKSIALKSPEYVLLIIVLLSGFTPPFNFNPLFIGVASIVVLQIIFNNRISGLVLGALFFLFNLFFLGALISEFTEFSEINSRAQKLLFGGLGIWLVTTFFSVTMVYKYTNSKFASKPAVPERKILS